MKIFSFYVNVMRISISYWFDLKTSTQFIGSNIETKVYYVELSDIEVIFGYQRIFYVIDNIGDGQSSVGSMASNLTKERMKLGIS